jgi:ATP-binding cassette subfamily B protein
VSSEFPRLLPEQGRVEELLRLVGLNPEHRGRFPHEFSGGQRQRIAIARALLIDPPVLIFDEATSALDAESEAIVNANLKRMAKGRTVITISHRLAMLVEADAILVLERGKVYDIGTHEELLRRCDIYKHMWYQQNRHLDPRETSEMPLISHGNA